MQINDHKRIKKQYRYGNSPLIFFKASSLLSFSDIPLDDHSRQMIHHHSPIYYPQASVWTEMSKELRFALSCDASSKPVRKKLPEHENGPAYLSMNTFGSTFTTSQYSFSSKDPVS